jgi:uncharacterized protein (DUF58 family)
VTTPLGLLLLAAAAAAAAESMASLTLFAVAVGLMLSIAFAGLTAALAARRLTVSRTVIEREVQEDYPVRLRFDVEGVKWLPVRIEAEDQSGAWVDLASAPAGTVLEVRVRRRGAYRLLPSRLRVRDALGIFQWPLRAGPPEPLLILPTPDGQANLHPRHPATTPDPEPDGLRAHSPGDSLARIHWPALARGAGLQVRRFAAAPDGLPLVVVDTAGTPDSHAVDWAARTAAGHILALTRNGGCRVLLPGDATETTVIELEAGWRALHRRLAKLDASVLGAPPQLPRGTPAIRVRASAAPDGSARAVPPALPVGVVPVVSEALEASI